MLFVYGLVVDFIPRADSFEICEVQLLAVGPITAWRVLSLQ
jgi:hypothetical protein